MTELVERQEGDEVETDDGTEKLEHNFAAGLRAAQKVAEESAGGNVVQVAVIHEGHCNMIRSRGRARCDCDCEVALSPILQVRHSVKESSVIVPGSGSGIIS